MSPLYIYFLVKFTIDIEKVVFEINSATEPFGIGFLVGDKILLKKRDSAYLGTCFLWFLSTDSF